MAIFALLGLFPSLFYGAEGAKRVLTFTQKAGMLMVIAHYLKREYETMFVH